MRGIPEKVLVKALHDKECNRQTRDVIKVLMKHCQELQEPWMTMDEFLKSGFEGKCWVLKTDQGVQFTECYESITGQKVFSGNTGSIPHSRIAKVMPIHKPEPPK